MDSQRYRDSLQLAGQVERLIAQVVPELNGAENPNAERLLQFSMRILSSRMAGASLTPLTQSAELGRRRLVQAGRASDALALSDVLQRLDGSAHGLSNLPALMQLLTTLMHSTPVSSLAACAGAALLSRPLAPAAAPTTRIDTAAVAPPEPDMSNESSAHRHGAGGEGRRAKAAVPKWKAGSAVGSTSGPSEEVLVRELLFVLQNIDGEHIRWDETRRVAPYRPP